jgi:beta-N-acetylhexosaminidase
MKYPLYLSLLLGIYGLLGSHDAAALGSSASDTLQMKRSRWADSVFQSLDTNQRIAQLLVIRAWSTKDSLYNDSLTRVVTGLDVGGVCFFRGTPCSQARLTNRLQGSARTPLLVAMDAEWGVGMRLDSVVDFPYQMTLGAIRDDSLIYRMSSQIARDCRRIGVHLNLAPVVDINNNPANPVINLRSFGEDPSEVSRKGVRPASTFRAMGIPIPIPTSPCRSSTTRGSGWNRWN